MCQDQTVLLFGEVVSSGVLLFKDVIAGWIKFCPGSLDDKLSSNSS